MKRDSRFWAISGAFGGLLFATNLALGAGLTYLSGNPGMSGLITGFTTAFFFYLAAQFTRRFGAITICFTLYCLLAVPTVLMGPPGLYKIAVGLAAGVVTDAVLVAARFRFGGFLVAFAAFVAVLLAGTFAAFILFEFPNFNRFRDFMFILAAIFTIEGWISAWATRRFLFGRVLKIPAVRRLVPPAAER